MKHTSFVQLVLRLWKRWQAIAIKGLKLTKPSGIDSYCWNSLEMKIAVWKSGPKKVYQTTSAKDYSSYSQ